MHWTDYARTAASIVRKRDPVQVILFVTARCNMACKMCFYWKEINSASRSEELTVDEIKRISATMRPFPWLLLAGGEPFAREDLGEICRVFTGQNRVQNITIPTNGHFTARIVDQARRIVTENPRVFLNLSLSIQGPTAEAHDAITQLPGSFDRLHETWQALDKLRSQHGNLGLGSVITMSAFNQHLWREMIDHVTDALPAGQLVLSKTRGNPRSSDAGHVDLALYRTASRYLRQKVYAGAVKSFDFPLGDVLLAKDIVSRELIAQTTERRTMQLPCFAGRLNAVISERGDVYPCELLDRKLGSLRDVDLDFQRIWQGKEAADARTFIRDTHCHCTHECFMATNILFNPTQYPRLGKAWAELKASRAPTKPSVP